CGLQSQVTFEAVCGQGYYIQFGAYGTTGFGSGNLSIGCAGGDPCGDPGIPGDLNGDGIVNAADLNILLAAWGTDSPIADINEDGIVNAADLNILLANWTV
ncbi:MAG: dockerin type I repeat-containing protein, partial [Phycisphaerales bacterium]